MAKRTIIWDFNGTLLNDMQVCIDCMNILLEDRGLNTMDLEKYRDIFTFPVRDYYQALGFNFELEPFEVPAHQFIDLYRRRLITAPLHSESDIMLKYFSAKGFRQIILSAMEQNLLEEALEAKGIKHYFTAIAGIRDHLADGKLEMAIEILRHHDLSREEYIMVGDTLHDLEVATGLGIDIVLVAQGHQSFERLSGLGCTVVKNLEELKTIIS